jgi:hypothetical protein
MMRHCFRSYCFGAILAARNQLTLGWETFFVAAMLHNLGSSDAHADDRGSFEWVGARLVHSFCLDAWQSPFWMSDFSRNLWQGLTTTYTAASLSHEASRQRACFDTLPTG